MAAMPERRRALVGAAPTIARKRPRTFQRTVQKCSTKLGQPWRRALEREVEPAPTRSKANDPYRPRFHLSRSSKIGRSRRTLDTSRRPTSSQTAHADHRVLKRLHSDFKARGGLIQRYNDRDALASEGCPQSLDRRWLIPDRAVEDERPIRHGLVCHGNPRIVDVPTLVEMLPPPLNLIRAEGAAVRE